MHCGAPSARHTAQIALIYAARETTAIIVGNGTVCNDDGCNDDDDDDDDSEWSPEAA